jgi:hypothetical protein
MDSAVNSTILAVELGQFNGVMCWEERRTRCRRRCPERMRHLGSYAIPATGDDIRTTFARQNLPRPVTANCRVKSGFPAPEEKGASGVGISTAS